MSLKPRSIGVQGLSGDGVRLIAVQGLWPVRRQIGGAVRRMAVPPDLRRDLPDDEMLLLIASAAAAAYGVTA